MGTLWVFGDSYSIDFESEGNWWCVDYIKWKGYAPKSWGHILSEKLGYNYKNFAFGGCDNFTIMNAIIDQLDNIEENDIVIVGWSPTNRFRLVYEDKWTIVQGFDINKLNDLDQEIFPGVCKRTSFEMQNNRNHSLYEKELNDWVKLIKKALDKNIVYSWGWHFEGTMDYLQDFLRIDQETKNIVADGHLAEEGHQKLADDMYTIVTEKPFRNLKLRALKKMI